MADGLHGSAGPQPQPSAKSRPRWRGLIALLVGAGLAKWEIYDPLYGHGAKGLPVYFPLVNLAVILIVYGALRVVLGERFISALELLLLHPRRLGWKGVLILLLFALITFAAWYWVRLQFWTQGWR